MVVSPFSSPSSSLYFSLPIAGANIISGRGACGNYLHSPLGHPIQEAVRWGTQVHACMRDRLFASSSRTVPAQVICADDCSARGACKSAHCLACFRRYDWSCKPRTIVWTVSAVPLASHSIGFPPPPWGSGDPWFAMATFVDVSPSSTRLAREPWRGKDNSAAAQQSASQELATAADHAVSEGCAGSCVDGSRGRSWHLAGVAASPRPGPPHCRSGAIDTSYGCAAE